MSEHWYQCKNCKQIILSSQKPNTNFCPSGRPHYWVDLAELGTKNFTCNYCGKLLQTIELPALGYCQNNSHGDSHVWVFLGTIRPGTLHYQYNYRCKRCNMFINSKNFPSVNACVNPGHEKTHLWLKI